MTAVDVATTITAILSRTLCTADGIPITATGPTPVLALCRALVAAGHNPRTPMHVYRGGVLALRVRSIGAAAALTVRETTRDGRPRFARLSSDGQPPMRFPARGAPYLPAAPEPSPLRRATAATTQARG